MKTGGYYGNYRPLAANRGFSRYLLGHERSDLGGAQVPQ